MKYGRYGLDADSHLPTVPWSVHTDAQVITCRHLLLFADSQGYCVCFKYKELSIRISNIFLVLGKYKDLDTRPK